MYKKYDLPKKPGPNKEISHSKTNSTNFKPNSIYCTCKTHEKNYCLQNLCNKCYKQIENSNLRNEENNSKYKNVSNEKRYKDEKDFIQNNESLQKVYEFINNKSFKEKRTITPNPLSKNYEPYEQNLKYSKPIEQNLFHKYEDDLLRDSTGEQNELSQRKYMYQLNNNNNDQNVSYNNLNKFDPNENMEMLKKKLYEIEKNLTNNNDIFFTPNLKELKSKSILQKNSPSRTNETAKKNTYQPTPSPYTKVYNKSQAKTLSPNITLYDNPSNNKLPQNSNSKREIDNNPYKNSKTLIQYQKHLAGNRETSKTLYEFDKLPLNKVKKTNTLKSQTSRPQNSQAGIYEAIQENNKLYENKNKQNQNRAKSALRYKPQIPETYQNNNHSFHNLDFFNLDHGTLHQDNYINPDDILKNFKKLSNPYPIRNNLIRNYVEDQESIEYLVQNHSSRDFPESQPKLSGNPQSETVMTNNLQYRNKSEKNLQNKGYLLNSLDREPDERDFIADAKNLSIDEKLSTKKINKMTNNDYKFFQKPLENSNYNKYEEPENDRFQRVKIPQKELLKKSLPFVCQEVIKEKTEENFIEGTEPSLMKQNFESMKGFERNNSKYNSLIGKDLSLSFVRKYEGHKNTVNALAYDSYSKTLWSGSHDYSIKVWEINSNNFNKHEAPYFEIKRHKRWVWSLLYDHDTKWMFSGAADNLIKAWDPQTFNQVLCFKGHNGGVLCLEKWNQNFLVSGSGDETLKIWDIEKNEVTQTLHEHRQRINAIHKINDENDEGALILSGSHDKFLKGWDFRSDRSVFSYQLHDNAITSIQSFHDTQILTVSLDKQIKITDIRNGKSSFSKTMKTEINCLEKIGSFYFIGTDTIDCFDPLSCTFVPNVHGKEHKGSIKKIIHIPEFKKVFSSSSDCSIIEWSFL